MGARSEEPGADTLAPLGSEREKESTRGREFPLTGGYHLSGGAGARPSWVGLGQNGFFLFPEFPNSFSISFL
jgi:hypothetical protein